MCNGRAARRLIIAIEELAATWPLTGPPWENRRCNHYIPRAKSAHSGVSLSVIVSFDTYPPRAGISVTS